MKKILIIALSLTVLFMVSNLYGEEMTKERKAEEADKMFLKLNENYNTYKKLDNQTLLKIFNDDNSNIDYTTYLCKYTALKKVINERLTSSRDKKSYDELIKGLSAILINPKRDTKRIPSGDKDRGDQEYIRWEITRMLGATKDKSVVPALIQALEDESLFVMGSAAANLRKLQDPRALPHLLKVFAKWKNPEWKKRMGVIPTTSEESAINLIMGALADIKGMEKEKVKAISEIVEDEELTWEKSAMFKRIAMATLGQIGKDATEAVEPLLKAMHRVKDITTRARIIDTLGKIGDKRAVEILIKELDKGDIYINKEAAEALAKIGDERAVKPLGKAIKRTNSKYLKDSYKKLTGNEYQER